MFQRPEQHENPPSRVPPLYTTTFNAKDVAVGVYLLNDVQVNMLTTWEPCHIQHLPKDVYSFTDMLVSLPHHMLGTKMYKMPKLYIGKNNLKFPGMS